MEATKIVGFGGFQEIGKSTMMIENENDIILIDSGIKFADSFTTGIKGVVPDYSYLRTNIDKVRGLFVTHGHEDHIGGVPYLLQQVDIKKIYAPKIAIEYLKLKLAEHSLKNKVQFIEITKELIININSLTIDFWTAQHSIPDAFGIRVKTVNGSIMCTGDFRFDYTPIGNFTDFTRLEEIGKEGLTVLLSDSTNAMRPMHSPSEKDILSDIKKYILEGKKKIIITAFASNLTRITALIKLAGELGKKVIAFGRSMVNGIVIGKKLGYIEGADDIIIDKKNYKNYDSNEILILTTGSQGEQMAALSRMAQRKHPDVKVENGDMIIFSSSPIPGNVMKIEQLINKLYKLGAIIKENRIDGYLHTSGHAYREEHEKIFNITKPKYFMPYHGEYRMAIAHANTAIDCGVAEENVVIANIGEITYMKDGKIWLSKEKIVINPVFIDGENVLPFSKEIFKKRVQLGESGFVNVVVLLDKKNNSLVFKPKIISRGCFYTKDSMGIIEEAKRITQGAINWLMNNKEDWNSNDIKQIIKSRIEPYFYKIKRRRPLIISSVLYLEEKDKELINQDNTRPKFTKNISNQSRNNRQPKKILSDNNNFSQNSRNSKHKLKNEVINKNENLNPRDNNIKPRNLNANKKDNMNLNNNMEIQNKSKKSHLKQTNKENLKNNVKE